MATSNEKIILMGTTSTGKDIPLRVDIDGRLEMVSNSDFPVTPGETYEEGDMLVYVGTKFVPIPKGADGQVLTMAAGLPQWQTLPEPEVEE